LRFAGCGQTGKSPDCLRTATGPPSHRVGFTQRLQRFAERGFFPYTLRAGTARGPLVSGRDRSLGRSTPNSCASFRVSPCVVHASKTVVHVASRGASTNRSAGLRPALGVRSQSVGRSSNWHTASSSCALSRLQAGAPVVRFMVSMSGNRPWGPHESTNPPIHESISPAVPLLARLPLPAPPRRMMAIFPASIFPVDSSRFSAILPGP